MSHLKPDYDNLRKCLREARELKPQPQHLAICAKAFSREAVGAKLAAVIEEVRATETVIPEPKEVPLGVVIMLTCNHLDKTKIAIESLKCTAPETSILVVDDGSDDGTQEWLRSEGVMVIESPTRNIATNWNKGVEWLLSQGFAYLNEIGWEGTIVFSDNDIVYQEGWFEGLWRVMESDPAIGVVAPSKFLPDGNLQNCGNWLSHEVMRGLPAVSGGDNRMLRSLYEADYVETACMMVRSEVWRTTRMDDIFPIFYNDVDYCFQARKLGYRVVATSLSSVVHTPHTTSSERSAEVIPLRNTFIRKWKETLRG